MVVCCRNRCEWYGQKTLHIGASDSHRAHAICHTQARLPAAPIKRRSNSPSGHANANELWPPRRPFFLEPFVVAGWPWTACMMIH
jgi:hypothetical protein